MTAEPSRRKTTEVAVGVMLRADGAVLLADRPPGKPYAGYWEFPGGKIEAGETVAAALARELHEELGIDIGPALPWITFEFDYPHAYVRLHFCRVFEWRGTPHAREGQRLQFFALNDALPAPLLPAAEPAVRWLTLPPTYALTNAKALGRDAFVQRLDRVLAQGLRLIQLREPQFAADEVSDLFELMLPRVRAHGARLLVSSRHARALWERADGVHFTSADLLRQQARPDVPWVAASIHTRDERARAAELRCDFCVAGAVLPTRSHPGQPSLGWHGFAELVKDTPLPVYALGGLSAGDVPRAMQAGAHGVAMLSAAWES